MSEPTFKVKHEPKAAYIPSFRIQPSLLERLKETAKRNDISMQELIRQMISFSLDHMESK